MDIDAAIRHTLRDDWRDFVDEMGVEAFVSWSMAEDGLPSWMRPAILDAVLEAYDAPRCEACRDTGERIEVEGPFCFLESCDCDAGRALSGHQIRQHTRHNRDERAAMARREV